VFGSIAIVFAVIGVNQGIFDPRGALEAMSAGWLVLAFVDVRHSYTLPKTQNLTYSTDYLGPVFYIGRRLADAVYI